MLIIKTQSRSKQKALLKCEFLFLFTVYTNKHIISKVDIINKPNDKVKNSISKTPL